MADSLGGLEIMSEEEELGRLQVEGEEVPKPNTILTSLRNPGRFGDLQKESRALGMMDIFRGFQFDYVRGVNNNFQATHSLAFPDKDQEPQSYNFSAAYFSSDQKNVLTARIDTDGTLMGRVNRSIDDVTVRLTAQTGPGTSSSGSFSAEVEYKGPDFTTEFAYSTNMHMWTASYMQRITKHWMMGVQGMYFHSQAASWLQTGLRYEDEDYAASAMLEGLSGAVVSFTRKISEQVRVTSEFRAQVSNAQRLVDTQALLGYEYRLRANTVTASIDTSGTLRSVYEDRNPMMGLGMTLCSEINFPARYYKFGMRFTLQL